MVELNGCDPRPVKVLGTVLGFHRSCNFSCLQDPIHSVLAIPAVLVIISEEAWLFK